MLEEISRMECPLDLENLFDQLYPLCRSITGPGLRKTLAILEEYMPLEHFSVPTGTKVFDWTIPQEWRIREAWIKDSDGNTVIDFANHNLHVINYSAPIDKVMSLDELKQYVYTLPEEPELIPYITSYYKRRSGFCMSHKQLESLREDRYHAYIDSEFVDGELNYSHCLLPGETEQEILISTYVCHPSMANNELSGPLTAVYLYHRLKQWASRRFTYRFVFLPETIGSISYLHQFGGMLKQRMHAGLVLTCMGGTNPDGTIPNLSYKESRRGNSPLDTVMQQIAKRGSFQGSIRDFTPLGGSDERQYCSPGFNLPVGQLARSVYGQYKQYHTSGDDKAFMTIEAVEQGALETERILQALELDGYYVNLNPYGEIKLDQHDLYPDMNSPTNRSFSSNVRVDGRRFLNRILMVLSYADGDHLLSEIAEKCGTAIWELLPVINTLQEKKLLAGPYAEKQKIDYFWE